jgi:sterol desaturase/sphingolipid hydroxylase (fatty acid hydroxylase superfamily)
MTALGLLYPHRDTWYTSLRDMYALLAIHYLVSSAIWEFLCIYVIADPVRIQANKKEPPLYKEEIRDCLLCMYVLATIVAWPVAMHRDGFETAFKPKIEDAAFFAEYTFYGVNMGYVYYGFKIFITTFLADAFTFWKHWGFHHPSVYAIHKGHHAYHNPSTFAGFSQHPIESFVTFCPIIFCCIPQVNLYAPMHLPFIAFFYYLNLYMHCGYRIPALEWVLSLFLIDTSDYHNLHHAHKTVHYAEMLTIWDDIMGTHTRDWDAKRLEANMASVTEESDVYRGVAKATKSA